MLYGDRLMDECRLQSSLVISPPAPILTVLPTDTTTFNRSYRRMHRFHPFAQQQLYRPHLNLLTRERSQSPPQVGTHVSRLYPEILAQIFSHLDVADKGRAAQVCVAWRDAAYHKSVWRGTEAKLHLRRRPNAALVNCLTRRGIKRIQILSVTKSFKEITQGISTLTSLDVSGCFNVREDNLYQAFAATVPSLLHLNLSMCKQITDKCILNIVRNVENLERLELGGCSNVTDVSLLAISVTLKRLKHLNLRSCWNITDIGIRALSGQTEKSSGNVALECLILQDCQRLTDDALKFLSAGLSNLNSINLSFCLNITDMGLKFLSKLTSLRELNFRTCDNVSDSGVAFLAENNLPLTALDLSFCDKITDQALDYISQGLFNLKRLSLSTCPITDDGICKIAKALTELEVLNVGQCVRITDKSLYAITEGFRNLKSVDIYGCPKITEEVVHDINLKFQPRRVLHMFL